MANLIIPRVRVLWGDVNLTSYTGGGGAPLPTLLEYSMNTGAGGLTRYYVFLYTIVYYTLSKN